MLNLTAVMAPKSPPVEVKEFSDAEEISGQLSFQQLEDKFMHSVMENDTQTIDKGKLLNDAINYGVGTFNPDLLFEQLTKSYAMAKQMYGESLIRLVSGFEGNYVKKNIRIPEFKKQLQERITQKIKELKDDGLLGKDQFITEKGIELASLVLYFQELDALLPTGNLGERLYKKAAHYGEVFAYDNFKKGSRYRDIAVKKSVITSMKRGRTHIDAADLKMVRRESKGKTCVIYGLDASGSMKGKKIESCKKAGIALAYNAVHNKDMVGLIVFGSDIKVAVEPTTDFTRLIKEITAIQATKETDIEGTLKKAIEMFPAENMTKHLVLITDALPTKGTAPVAQALGQAAIAQDRGITISVVGINLDEKGREFAQKIVEIGGGRLYGVRDVDMVDSIVLEDYYAV